MNSEMVMEPGPEAVIYTTESKKKWDLKGIIGQSSVFLRVLSQALAVAELDVTLLLMGETGTGKSELAHCIHKNSKRKNGPLIHLNCANIPEQLLESELFGAMKGAHSGATTNIEGKITAVLPSTMFRAELKNGHQVLAHISGKLRKHFIKITVGDIVKMEMSPNDLEKARIVYRLKNAEVNRNAPIRSFGPRNKGKK